MRAVVRSLEISIIFTPKEKFYDKNSTDLSLELIVRPQLVPVFVVRIFRQSLQSLSVFHEKAKSFDLLSTWHLSTWYVTVKMATFRLLAGQMENILNLTLNE